MRRLVLGWFCPRGVKRAKSRNGRKKYAAKEVLRIAASGPVDESTQHISRIPYWILCCAQHKIHGRRHFVDQIENFPEECRQVIQSIGQIYHHDDQAKELHLTDTQRLAYHQEHSGPVMAQLKTWMQEQIDQKRVEPNSGLGQAIAYMLKHWKPLTRFLEVAGAPLDNNICERALKTAIMHRKNSMSYKTKTGARIGDIFMSLLHTCQLNGINPFVYLMALSENAAQVAKDPMDWLPWTYRQTLERSQKSEPANTS